MSADCDSPGSILYSDPVADLLKYAIDSNIMRSMRYLPNVISALRLTAVPVLVWLAWDGAERAFAWLLVAAGATDLLDGWLARRFGWVSKVGAMLDSAADISIVLVVLFALWTLHPEIFVQHGFIIWAILAIWSVSNLIGIFRYKRLASFHTGFARFALMTFGVFVLVLFFYGFIPWLLYFCGAICFLAGVENLLLVLFVERWKPNLRGGLRAVIRARSKRSRAAE